MRHFEGDRCGERVGVGDPYSGDIVAAKDADGRLLDDVRASAFPFTIQKALNEGQKGDELAVVPFLKQAWVACELVR